MGSDTESKIRVNRNVIPPIIIQLALALFGGLIFGYNLGNINSVDDLMEKPWHLSDLMKEMSTSSLIVGCMVGSIVSGWIADFFGRRWTIVGLAVIGGGLTVILGFSFHIIFFIILRAMLGLTVGAIGTAVPMLLSEITTSKMRGWITAIFQVAITLGILLGYFFGWGFSYLKIWEPIILLGALPCLFIVLMFYFIPESTQWREMKEAKRHENDEGAEPLEKAGWGEIVTTWWKCFAIGIILALGQQLTGINSIIFYSKDIFRMSGLGDYQFELQVAVGVWNMLTTIFALPFIDWVGRRPLIIIGFAGLTVANFIVGFSFIFKVGIPGVLGIFIFIAFFELGPGPLFYVIISEIYPVRIKGKMMALCNFLQWTCNLIIAVSFLTLSFGGKTTGPTFFVYGLVGIITTIALIILLPESKKKDLDDLHESLRWTKGVGYKPMSSQESHGEIDVDIPSDSDISDDIA